MPNRFFFKRRKNKIRLQLHKIMNTKIYKDIKVTSIRIFLTVHRVRRRNTIRGNSYCSPSKFSPNENLTPPKSSHSHPEGSGNLGTSLSRSVRSFQPGGKAAVDIYKNRFQIKKDTKSHTANPVSDK